MENKSDVVRNTRKEALKREVDQQSKQLVNNCLQSAKAATGEVAKSFLSYLWDSLIDWVNSQMAA